MDRRRYREHLETLQRTRPHAHESSPRAQVPAAAAVDRQHTDRFAAFSTHDYLRRIRLHPEMSWEDACHAYALAAATHPDYGGQLDLDAEGELENQWELLRGDAGPDWSIARTLLRETWRWLDGSIGPAGTLH
ncbi:hypothetical protein [Pseudoxanthomonas putridarboris]|uniref:Uncharacterized protein n=1 Tax=Pseudoxanthomonas putridarboris TaxID=752605 RepID=A0ABU9J4R6_9GAMM